MTNPNPRASSGNSSNKALLAFPKGEGARGNPVTIELSRWFSLNNMHDNIPGRGRVTSNEYRIWKDLAGWELLNQHPRKIKGPVALQYEFKKGRADLGNLEKACTDLLVTHGVIEGDGPNIVREIWLAWSDVEGVRVTVCPV
jgi:Holliday junction resolvase RusA-like endonuclease